MRILTSVLCLTFVTLQGQPAAQGGAPAQPLASAIAAIASASDGVTWITWSVPAAPTARLTCCDRAAWIRGTRLRGDRPAAAAGSKTPCLVEDRHSFSMSDEGTPPDRIMILVKVESRRVGRVRVERDDCQLDFGRASVVALPGVAPPESVAWLEQHFKTGSGRHEPHGDVTLAALALHGDPAADRVLERFVRAGEPSETRRGAAFWLASARGRRGYDTLRGLLGDRDDSFREHLTFALHVSPEADATVDLINLAKHDAASGVRRQALFWLAQRAGEAAVSTLKAAVDDDPDADVRQHAVFAVSQLPRDRSVPLLIELSRTHRSPEVRRQAIFWLGQSDDPRALAYFEEVLGRP